jgi:lipoate-protein ligase A
MYYCDLTFPTPEENLACDEALLDWAEDESESFASLGAPASRRPVQSVPVARETPALPGILRIWESTRYFVVLGYANHVASEVNIGFCRQNTIPILRRCSGGGTVLQGPGLLNYTLVLPAEPTGPLHTITAANRFIMERHRGALAALLSAPVEVGGHTDLTIGGLKFCGNAQRRRKQFLLFHGSFLLHFDIDLVEKALPMPSIEPDYRRGRRHHEFMMNLKIHRDLLKKALAQAWQATTLMERLPYDRIDVLAREKYGSDEWNAKF